MISAIQAKLARTMLGLKQKQAAEKINIAHTTLSNIEKGGSDPPASRLQELQHFYESEGIEFLDRDGVRRKTAGLLELKGHEGFKEFIYDVYKTVKGGGDICVTNVDERQFEYWQGIHAEDYLSKMAGVKGLTFRAIIQKGDDYFTASKYAQYRMLDEKHFSGVPTYVYGNKKAEILFDEHDVTIFIIDNSKLADAQRRLFDIAWGLADEPI